MQRRQAHSHVDDSYWDKLDNAAKIIPAVSNSRASNVFRISTVLHEDVEPERLSEAVERALAALPAFGMTLHRGLFWYYFDVNHTKPWVHIDNRYPCSPMREFKDDGYLFRVTYYKKRINLEMYHVLSDGMGAINLLYVILSYYFHLKNPELMPEEEIRSYCDSVARDFDEDSFVRSVAELEKAAPSAPAGKKSEPDAFHMNGYRYDDQQLGVLTLLMPADKLLSIAHDCDATITQYIAALLIWSIYNTSYRRSTGIRPISISLPVNLRSMFDSTTMRNFFGHVNISVRPKPGDKFEDIVGQVKSFFENCIKREYFERQIAGNVAIEKITPVRFVPIWIKDLVMKLLFARAEKKYTLTLSNLGRIKMPEQITPLIDRFELMLGGSHTHPKKTGLCSYGNTLALSFSSTIFDNSLERFYVKFLTERGVDVTVVSNETPPPTKKSRSERKAEKAAVKAAKAAGDSEKKAEDESGSGKDEGQT